jgi:hypothetical protein
MIAIGILVVGTLLGASLIFPIMKSGRALRIHGIIWDCLLAITAIYPRLLMGDVPAGHAGSISSRLILAFLIGIMAAAQAAILWARVGWARTPPDKALRWAAWNQLALFLGAVATLVLHLAIRGFFD